MGSYVIHICTFSGALIYICTYAVAGAAARRGDVSLLARLLRLPPPPPPLLLPSGDEPVAGDLVGDLIGDRHEVDEPLLGDLLQIESPVLGDRLEIDEPLLGDRLEIDEPVPGWPPEGLSPLHIAARAGQQPTVAWLLANGAPHSHAHAHAPTNPPTQQPTNLPTYQPTIVQLSSVLTLY